MCAIDDTTYTIIVILLVIAFFVYLKYKEWIKIFKLLNMKKFIVYDSLGNQIKKCNTYEQAMTYKIMCQRYDWTIKEVRKWKQSNLYSRVCYYM